MNKENVVWIDLYKTREGRTLKKQKHLLQFIKSEYEHILELFVATGQNFKVLKRNNSSAFCVGIDYDYKLCQEAKEMGFRTVVGDIRYFPFKKASFDLIYSNSFHHVSHDANKVIDNSLELLKRGGRLVGVEPYGIISTVLAGVIYVLPGFLINLFPKRLKIYVKAIKYECKEEGVIHWYYNYVHDFKKELEKHKLISVYYDLLRIYYCIERE